MKLKQIFTGLFMSVWAVSMNAAIVHTDINDFTVVEGTDYNVDLNQDGTNEFTFSSSGGCVGTMFDSDQLNFITWSAASDWDAFKPVTAGSAINSTGGFYALGDCYFNPSWAAPTSMIPLNTDVYIGIRFKIGTNTHYAWMRVNLPSAGSLIIKDFAYESSAGTGINAGSTGNTTTISEEKAASVSVFPNPATEYIKINMPETTDYRVSVFNIEGKVMFSFVVLDCNEYLLSVDGFEYGEYFLTVEGKNGCFYTSPLIVQ